MPSLYKRKITPFWPPYKNTKCDSHQSTSVHWKWTRLCFLEQPMDDLFKQIVWFENGQERKWHLYGYISLFHSYFLMLQLSSYIENNKLLAPVLPNAHSQALPLCHCQVVQLLAVTWMVWCVWRQPSRITYSFLNIYKMIKRTLLSM